MYHKIMEVQINFIFKIGPRRRGKWAFQGRKCFRWLISFDFFLACLTNSQIPPLFQIAQQLWCNQLSDSLNKQQIQYPCTKNCFVVWLIINLLFNMNFLHRITWSTSVVYCLHFKKLKQNVQKTHWKIKTVEKWFSIMTLKNIHL